MSATGKGLDPLTILAVAVGAFALSAGLTPFAGLLAKRIGLVSRSREDRWRATRPVPLLGGAAMAFAVGVTIALFSNDGPLAMVLLGALGVFALGLVDDFRHIAPTTKFVGQVVMASLLVFGGVRVQIVDFAPLAFLLTVFWVVGIMNALNLIDNMDGLAAGTAVIAALTLAITALPDNPAAALLAASVVGAALGFLLHNFPPARVFMGDAGSQLLGFLLAAAGLLHTASAATNVGLALLGPLAALALPIFDTALVATSRRLAGMPISQGGRDHTSHRLAALGLSDRGTVLLLYAVASALGALGILADALSLLVVPLLGLAGIALLLFGVFLHEVDVYGWSGAHEFHDWSNGRSAVLRGFWIYGRFGAEVGLDAILLTIAYFIAYIIRFEGVSDAVWLPQFIQSTPVVIAAQLAVLVLFGVYRTLWRYLGISDAIAILRATAVGTGLAALVIVFGLRLPAYSRAVFVLNALLAGGLLVATRAFLLWLRHWFAVRPRVGEVRVLIVGANDRGAFAARLLLRSRKASYRVVGFLDDDPGKRYRSMAGIPIVGPVSELEAIIERHRAGLVVVAVDRDGEPVSQRVRASCAALGVECREVLVSV